VNALVKVTIDEIHAALRRVSKAARIGALTREEFADALRDSPLAEDLFADKRAAKRELREKVIAHRDAAPAQFAREEKSRVEAYEAARAELDRIEAARLIAQDALYRARVARDASARALESIVKSDNLLLEQTADPLIGLFIAKIDDEWQHAHACHAFTRPDRFVPPAGAAKKHTPAKEELRATPGNPRLLTLVPTDEHAQLSAYMNGLRTAADEAVSLKLTPLDGESLLTALTRIEAAIPHRDASNLVVASLRENAKAARGGQA
jgi:hypothetical protein